jgi:hypothetical protein
VESGGVDRPSVFLRYGSLEIPRLPLYMYDVEHVVPFLRYRIWFGGGRGSEIDMMGFHKRYKWASLSRLGCSLKQQ